MLRAISNEIARDIFIKAEVSWVLNPEVSETDKHITKKQLGREFWNFHLIFWSITTFIMLLSGLTQYKVYEVALVRNLLYGSLGLFSTLMFIPLFDKHRFQSTLKMLTLCVTISYVIGTVVTLLINPISAAQSGFILWDRPWTRWFAGSLNFSLVTLVWCSFYLAFKHGLRFVRGERRKRPLKRFLRFPHYQVIQNL